MNLLFITDNNSEKHQIAAGALVKMLLDFSSNIEILDLKMDSLLTKEKGIKRIGKNVMVTQTNYSLILTFNKLSLKESASRFNLPKLPLVHFMFASEYMQEYVDVINRVSKIVLLDAFCNYPTILFRTDITEKIILPVSPLQKKKYEIKNKKKSLVFIDSGENPSALNSVFQLIPVLNNLKGFEITLLLEGGMYPKVFNPNIDVLDCSVGQKMDIINKADVIMGNGTAIKVGMAACKPCIVIGDRGFGGLVSERNYSDQHQTNFQGRIGGEPGEFIPQEVILNEIFDVLEMSKEQVQEIIDKNFLLLLKSNKESSTKLRNLLQKEINNHQLTCTSPKQVHYVLSRSTLITQYSSNYYLILDALTRKKQGVIEKEEYRIVELFKEANTLSGALKESGYEEEPKLFYNFVEELVNEKILKLNE